MTVGGGGGEGRLLRTCSLMSSSVVPVANTTLPGRDDGVWWDKPLPIALSRLVGIG